MKLSAIVYALLCVLVPPLWGLVVVWVSNRIEDRLRSRQKLPQDQPPMPPIDYHI